MSSETEIRPFRVDMPDQAVVTLRQRIAARRWPSRELVADRSQGVQLATLQELAGYWTTHFDWRKAEAKLNASTFQLYASYTFIDARFLDALQVGSNSPFADENGNIQILPGNQIPGIPRHRVKAGFDYSITDAFKIGGDALYVSSQYLVGDESNQAPKLASYAVFNVHASYQINKSLQVYAKVNNVFDNRYATYGTFFDAGALPNFAAGGAAFTDARSLSPALPRVFYAGLKMTF